MHTITPLPPAESLSLAQIPPQSLKARLKLLSYPTFRLRYIYRNIDKSRQAFLGINHKATIRKQPLCAIYLLPLLILRKALYTLECFSQPLIQSKILSHSLPKPPKLAGLICLPALLLQKLARIGLMPLSSFMHARIFARFLLGRVDMPYFELVLTTRCTLRCESCNNLMQYFDSSSSYTCTLEGIAKTLETLLAKIDSIYNIRIIGGEPLLFKDIDAVVKILDSSKKVKSFDIVTNATILPKPALLKALQASAKCFISISDYTKSPNLDIKLHIHKLQEILQAHKIPHHILWQEAKAAWFSPGKIYKRGRDRQGIVDNFLHCQMPCVSIMSHEMIGRSLLDKLESSPTSSIVAPPSKAQAVAFSKASAQSSVGEIFICPIASSLSRLKGLEEFSGDFVSLDSACDKYEILNFYAKEFFKACDYCHDMAAPKESIPIAVQTSTTLKLTP